MPRLAPRRQRQTDENGLENESPFLNSTGTIERSSSFGKNPRRVCRVPELPPHRSLLDSPPLSPVGAWPSMQQFDPEAYRRRILSNKKCSGTSAPPIIQQPQQQQATLKSPVASNETYSDSAFSDCSLTPPVTGPRPLVVTSKRVGNDVRRRQAKRRRFRAYRGADGNNETSGGFCIWEDTNLGEKAPQYPDSSDEEDESDARKGLPFLFKKQEVSPMDKTRKYWEWCYGKGATIELSGVQGWSAKREPPAKSCLSNSRSKIQTTPFARLRTPPTSPEDAEELLNQSAESKKNCHVQFGSPKAAEYDIDGPTGWLTPLPPHVAKKRFSMDQKATTQEEEEVTEETKQNSALLAAWEESFEEPSSTSRRRRQKNRRSSSLFSPSPSLTDGKADKSLLADWDESPISVDDKGGRKSINPPPVELISNNATPSPSAEVAKGLESLGFDSPDTDAFGNELNFSGAVGESTAEFRVDLNDVNTLGGALQESSPPGAFGPCGTPQRRRLLKSPLAAKENNSDLTPPPADDSLESVHSVGGALDRESPPGSHIQSCLAATQCERGDITDDKISLSQTRFEAGGVAAGSTNIVDRLLRDPASDQEWELADLLWNLCDKNDQKMRLEPLLRDINFRFEGVRACLDDLLENVKHRAKMKPTISEDSIGARQQFSREWKEMEIKFLNDLSRNLSKSSNTAESLLKVSVTREQRIDPQSKHTSTSLKRDIEFLKKKIKLESDLLAKREATEAPHAAVLCQATSHIGLCGFRIEAYTGGSLHLSFEHAVGWIQSNFVFDLQNQSVSVSTAETNNGIADPSAPISVDAMYFQRHFLKELVDNPTRLSTELENLVLDEQVLMLSKWLGRLDKTTLDICEASKHCSLNINELPSITMSFSKDTVLNMTFEHSLSNQNFVPTKVAIKGKRDFQIPFATKSTFLQELVDLCSGMVKKGETDNPLKSA